MSLICIKPVSVYSQSDWTPEQFKPSLLASLLDAWYPVYLGLLRASNSDIADFKRLCSVLSRSSILELSVTNQFITFKIFICYNENEINIFYYIKTMNWLHWNHQSPISSRRPFCEKIDCNPLLGPFRFGLITFPECFIICW